MIVPVDRLDDPRLAAYRHIGDHNWLRVRGLFVAEGRLVLQRTLADRRFIIESALVTPTVLGAFEDALHPLAAPVFVMPQPAFDDVAGFKFHRGCLALVRRPGALAVDDIAGSHLLLGLEAVGNPDNIGGLFRTAAAFGAGGLLLDRSTADPFYRKALRTSMGAVLRLPFARVDEWPRAVPDLRRIGYSVVALTPHADAMVLERFAASTGSNDRLLVLVGTEGAGVSPSTLAVVDHRVRIPMAAGVDSLNVTVAAGVALSRLARSFAILDGESD